MDVPPATAAMTPSQAPAAPTIDNVATPQAQRPGPPVERLPLVERRPPRQSRAKRPPRRGRRVKRIVRRIELWSVLKLSLVFYTCMYAVTIASLVLLWGLANSAGLVDNFEGFMADVGFENWQFYGEDMFRKVATIGAVLVLAGTVMTVLATALINVISELTGGIRLVVIEEDPRELATAEAPTPATVEPAQVIQRRPSRRWIRNKANDTWEAAPSGQQPGSR